MKNCYLSLCFILFTSLVFSQSYHDTKGKLEISSSGQSVYTLPIALPPSIQNVGPTINLVYTSGQPGGIAGQGWNISGISTISRIATRRDLDGFVDGVDFDDNDRLALDGQRLLLKTGTYWGEGSTYETEIQSNLHIVLHGFGSDTEIVVTSPDGSQTWYGIFPGRSAGAPANDLDTFFYVKKFIDTNGNAVEYRYATYGAKGSYPKLYIDEILFSFNYNGNNTYLNKVKFNYVAAARKETSYLNGIRWEKTHVLNNIEVRTNNLLFKKYQLTHTTDNYGYQRLVKIQESNGVGETANPVEFQYDTTGDGISQVLDWFSALDAPNAEDVVLHGDFNGDLKNDYVMTNHL